MSGGVVFLKNVPQLRVSWEKGATSWVVTGDDGIRFYKRKEDKNENETAPGHVNPELWILNEEDLLQKLSLFLTKKTNSIHTSY